MGRAHLAILLALLLSLAAADPGVLNSPPQIVGVQESRAVVGRPAVFTVSVFDSNGADDLCPAGTCNITCSYSELAAGALIGKEKLSCIGRTCLVFGEFTASDLAPSWDPKTSKLTATVQFSDESRPGRWECLIWVADSAGSAVSRAESIQVYEQDALSSVFLAGQNVFLYFIIPLLALLTLILPVIGLLNARYRDVDWEKEAEGFVATKALLAAVREGIAGEPDIRIAQKGRGLMLAAAERRAVADYSSADWLARQALYELGAKGRARTPRRILTVPERIELIFQIAQRK